MKPFQFQSVLNYRRRIEDNARKNLTLVQREEEALLKKKHQAVEELETLYKNQRDQQAVGTTVDQLIMAEARIAVIRDQLTTSEQELEKVREKVQRRRNGLLKAGQDKRALEKLKEKQNIAYKNFLDKKEAVMLDEIAILFHGR